MPIEVKNDFNAKNLTSFKVSGLIKNAYFPENIDELTELLQTKFKPLVLGNCSNILISSHGYDGDIIFTSKCNNISFDKNNFGGKQMWEERLGNLDTLIGKLFRILIVISVLAYVVFIISFLF